MSESAGSDRRIPVRDVRHIDQNRLLTEMAVEMLAEKGFDVRLHQDIPANDGGLAFGQIIEAMYAMGNNGDDTQQEMQS